MSEAGELHGDDLNPVLTFTEYGNPALIGRGRPRGGGRRREEPVTARATPAELRFAASVVDAVRALGAANCPRVALHMGASVGRVSKWLRRMEVRGALTSEVERAYMTRGRKRLYRVVGDAT